MLETLFESYDVTDHVYTWDYQKAESAVSLLDAGESRFVLVTSYSFTDEETGAMGDFRTGGWLIARIYDKASLAEVGQLDLSTNAQGTSSEELHQALQGEPWNLALEEVSEVRCEQGAVSIREGDLVLER